MLQELLEELFKLAREGGRPLPPTGPGQPLPPPVAAEPLISTGEGRGSRTTPPSLPPETIGEPETAGISISPAAVMNGLIYAELLQAPRCKRPFGRGRWQR